MIRKLTTGTERFAADAVSALAYRATGATAVQPSPSASKLIGRPLWAIAAECLQHSGEAVDMHGNRELIAERAMQQAGPNRRTFYSDHESPDYVRADAGSHNRVGDFPNILSGLAKKILDDIELDDDYSYPHVSAVIPGGLRDFKSAPMINRSQLEELDEVSDAAKFQELGLSEEVLSYLYLRRFGNSIGLTPVMVANDDLGAFGDMLDSLGEAWKVTQNRLVIDRYTSSESLLDGSPLFADRADVGNAANNNARTSGGVPSDTEWSAMENLYSDVGGVGTSRRVRGSLDTAFIPSGTATHEARRTFDPLAVGGLEPKSAATTANVGIFRGNVKVVSDSELRSNSTTTWYGLRGPTNPRTATVVRAYFAGFGEHGKRETWYDHTTKTSWLSLEGRIAVAVKNWRYAIRNVA